MTVPNINYLAHQQLEGFFFQFLFFSLRWTSTDFLIEQRIPWYERYILFELTSFTDIQKACVPVCQLWPSNSYWLAIPPLRVVYLPSVLAWAIVALALWNGIPEELSPPLSLDFFKSLCNVFLFAGAFEHVWIDRHLSGGEGRELEFILFIVLNWKCF